MLASLISFFLMAYAGVHAPFIEISPRFEFVPAMKNLDLNKLNGKWWFYKTIDNYYFKETVTCPVLNFYINPGQITVIDDYILNQQKPKEHSRLRWNLRQNKASNDVGNMIATKFSLGLGLVEYTYDIVATDYENFIYVNIWKPDEYPVSLGKSQRQGGVVFTKKMALGKEDAENIDNKVKKAMDENNIESFFYTNLDNSGCQDVEFPKNV